MMRDSRGENCQRCQTGGQRVVEILKQQVDLQPGVYETGVCIRLYGQGIDMPLAIDHTQPVSGVPTFRTDWTLTDEQGTVRVLLKDWGGGTLERHSVNYTPFGAPDGEPTADNNVYYAGREYDSFTEFYNNRARWYDPAAGRFISEDPDRFRAGDTNLYRYCHNSPANFTDPSGHIASWICGAIGATVGAVGYSIYGAATGTFTWSGLAGAAATGGAAGLIVGAFTGDVSGVAALAAAGYLAAGATVGAAHGVAETYAANPNATGGEAFMGGGMGALFGTMNPAGEFVSAGGAVVGGAIDASTGGQFLGRGFQVGGLAGTLVGGFGSAARQAWRQGAKAAFRAGDKAIAWEAGGIVVGGGIGYATTGTFEGTFHGATLGMFGGGIARGAYGLYNRARIARTAAAPMASHSFRTGDEARDYLAQMLGASQNQKEITLMTAIGKGATRTRRVDVLVDAVAHESKMGFQSYSQRVLTQIEKDQWLFRNSAEVEEVLWHFFRSAETGRSGADPRVLDALRDAGIGYIFHP